MLPLPLPPPPPTLILLTLKAESKICSLNELMSFWKARKKSTERLDLEKNVTETWTTKPIKIRNTFFFHIQIISLLLRTTMEGKVAKKSQCAGPDSREIYQDVFCWKFRLCSTRLDANVQQRTLELSLCKGLKVSFEAFLNGWKEVLVASIGLRFHHFKAEQIDTNRWIYQICSFVLNGIGWTP